MSKLQTLYECFKECEEAINFYNQLSVKQIQLKQITSDFVLARKQEKCDLYKSITG